MNTHTLQTPPLSEVAGAETNYAIFAIGFAVAALMIPAAHHIFKQGAHARVVTNVASLAILAGTIWFSGFGATVSQSFDNFKKSDNFVMGEDDLVAFALKDIGEAQGGPFRYRPEYEMLNLTNTFGERCSYDVAVDGLTMNDPGTITLTKREKTCDDNFHFIEPEQKPETEDVFG